MKVDRHDRGEGNPIFIDYSGVHLDPRLTLPAKGPDKRFGPEPWECMFHPYLEDDVCPHLLTVVCGNLG